MGQSGRLRVARPQLSPRSSNMTVCPSGLRGWTQVPLAQAAWVQIPQLSGCLPLLCLHRGHCVDFRAGGGVNDGASSVPLRCEAGCSRRPFAQAIGRHAGRGPRCQAHRCVGRACRGCAKPISTSRARHASGTHDAPFRTSPRRP